MKEVLTDKMSVQDLRPFEIEKTIINGEISCNFVTKKEISVRQLFDFFKGMTPRQRQNAIPKWALTYPVYINGCPVMLEMVKNDISEKEATNAE